VQPTRPPTNQNLMELLIMVDAARRASGTDHAALAAARRSWDQPRPITAKLVANLLTAAGVDRADDGLSTRRWRGFSTFRWITSRRR
jgi:ribose-phosphate pyrophosphokinase